MFNVIYKYFKDMSHLKQLNLYLIFSVLKNYTIIPIYYKIIIDFNNYKITKKSPDTQLFICIMYIYIL